MYFAATLAAVAAGLVGRSLAIPAPLIVNPGNPSDIVITSQDTLNGTLIGGTSQVGIGAIPNAIAQLGLAFENNFSGASVNVYITGLDTNNDVVFVTSNGQFYYPPFTTSTTPVPIPVNVAIPLGGKGTTTSLSLPNYLSSGRIWVAAGDLEFFTVDAGGVTGLVEPAGDNPSDPSAGINWGFVELTNGDAGIYADISYVDFVGMPLGISLLSEDGTQTYGGVPANGVSEICAALVAQAAVDGAPWNELCMYDAAGALIRVMAPSDYIGQVSTAFDNYWTNYVNEVWDYYTTNTLTMGTQTGSGDVSCTVVNDLLTCTNDNRGYAKPVAGDIFGCNSGPFAIEATDNAIHQAVVPRLCAAFDRSTLLLSGGNIQPNLPSADYYTVTPTNYYSKIVHEFEVGGFGYAFPYDDVTPTGQPSAAGLAYDPNPLVLTVIIGGPLTSTTSTSTAPHTSTSSTKTTTPTTTTSATSPTGTGGWKLLGCYTDNVSARTLVNAEAVPGGPTAMTVQACQTVCQGLGYLLAGVEYADECCKCPRRVFLFMFLIAS
jgi:hypothetical protein